MFRVPRYWQEKAADAGRGALGLMASTPFPAPVAEAEGTDAHGSSHGCVKLTGQQHALILMSG